MMRLNLKEIAKFAGVSPSTVSLVLSHKGSVGDKTRETITALLQKNGYEIANTKPEVKQKNLRFLKFSKHSYLVNGNSGFVSAIIDAVEKEARQLGYNLIMTVFDENNLAEILDMVRNQPLDGIILLATELEREHLVHFHDIPVPMVVVDNYMSFQDYNCVDMNNTEATFSAVKYLAALGHREIGYLYNNLPSSNCRARRSAFKSALKMMNLPFDASLIYFLHPTLSGAYQMTLELLRKRTPFPPALIATNDSIALGAIKAFKEYGIRVPDDISVIGFDDIPFSAIADPPLTTLNISCKEIGMWTVRLLHDRIQNQDSPIMKIQVGANLIIRSSTCAYHKIKVEN